MQRGFYAGIAGLNTQQRRMETVSDNLANASTSGFKKETRVIAPFQEMMVVAMKAPNGRTGGEIGTTHVGSMVEDTFTDFSEGVLVETGKATDLALNGAGFFTLEDQSGNHHYTRNGQFHVDSEGFIVHTSGMRLLGESGPVQVPGDNFEVSGTGTVMFDGEDVDNLAINGFENPGELLKTTGAIYTTPENMAPEPVEGTVLQQGFVEQANIDPVVEMVTAMEVLRAYSAGQKSVQAHDQLNDKAVREVGRIS